MKYGYARTSTDDQIIALQLVALRPTAERIDHARKLIDQGESRQYVANLLNLGRSTLYRSLAV